MKVTLIQATPSPIETIAKIASICYNSDPKDPEKMVRHLYSNGHHSVFEHVWFTFLIEDVSRVCSHQLVRHRLAAVTQRSQRYCDEDKAGYVTPDDILQDEDAERVYTKTLAACAEAYDELTKLHNIKKEDARFILPNATQTSLYFSCNLRELIHICNERLCSRAQWEIRDVVRKMRDLVPEDIRWMLVPKCESGYLVCNTPCYKRKEK